MTRTALRVCRTWHMDSRRWDGFRPRDGDVVIGTFPKCGTTWTQQIVSLLIFESVEPKPVMAISPWVDARFMLPIEDVLATIEAQTHRRFLKTHLPFDALPVFDTVRYIHVARDGLDAFMSWHNHTLRYKRFAALDAVGLGDETIGRPYPRPSASPREFFSGWMEDAAAPCGVDCTAASFLDIELSYWSARRAANVLLVHYNDLKADLDGEMRRVASFLGCEPPADLWPKLVEAATFEAMKREGKALLPSASAAFEGGHEGFLFSGKNERWRGVLSEDDIARYRERARGTLSAGLQKWLEHGRLGAGEPRTAAD